MSAKKKPTTAWELRQKYVSEAASQVIQGGEFAVEAMSVLRAIHRLDATIDAMRRPDLRVEAANARQPRQQDDVA
jgi:aminoglycoside phosphotransferase (APT) family kinase protein